MTTDTRYVVEIVQYLERFDFRNKSLKNRYFRSGDADPTKPSFSGILKYTIPSDELIIVADRLPVDAIVSRVGTTPTIAEFITFAKKYPDSFYEVVIIIAGRDGDEFFIDGVIYGAAYGWGASSVLAKFSLGQSTHRNSFMLNKQRYIREWWSPRQ